MTCPSCTNALRHCVCDLDAEYEDAFQFRDWDTVEAIEAQKREQQRLLAASRRPSWDRYFLHLAEAVAMRADCTRRQVGAAIVDAGHRIVSTGYNGAPSGEPGCLTDGACPRGRSNVEPGSSYDTGPGSCIAVHAEANAIIYAGQQSCVGSTLYLTDEPCQGCWRLIKASGLARVVWVGGEWKR